MTSSGAPSLRTRHLLPKWGLLLCALLPTFAAASAQQAGLAAPSTREAVDLIKEEGFRNSHVMETASWLTDVYGARLTGSPRTEEAAHWVLERFGEWGLHDSRLERWGPFGWGWTNERTVVHVTRPVPFPLIAHPNPWSAGTGGAVEAEVVISPVIGATSREELEPHQGTLEGKVVLFDPEPGLPLLFEPQALRLGREELDRIAAERPPGAGRASRSDGSGPPGAEALEAERSHERLLEFYAQEGVVALLRTTSRPPGGGVVHMTPGGWTLGTGERPAVPVLSVAAEHYGRVFRTLEKGIPVHMELDVENRFTEGYVDGFNILAEMEGEERPEEIVTIGAHFDSWHMGTGATDNAAGVAVVMEAMRILSAVDLPLRRTVRVALWTGEEQGLIGSRVHVQRRFGSSEAPSSAHERFSLYLNVDNGAGAIRGVSLQGNERAGAVFRRWMRWVDSDSITVRHTSLRNAGGTDHLSFDHAGLPGFQFIQDPLEYGTRTHHTSMDVYERLPERDMRHNAVVLAVFAYLAATERERFPRKDD